LHTVKILIAITAIAALIIGASLFEGRLLRNDANNLGEKISTIEKSTKQEDWSMAEKNLNSVIDEWPKVENKWSVILDHAEIDNIEDALIKVAAFIKAKDSTSALAELASLKNFINHIPEKEAFNLKNIF
jgi:hypothetical protein